MKNRVYNKTKELRNTFNILPYQQKERAAVIHGVNVEKFINLMFNNSTKDDVILQLGQCIKQAKKDIKC